MIGHEPLIHEATASHAAATPDATALIAGEDHVSYAVLDAAASAYAADLADLGVGPGQVVPLLLPRSVRLVALQLGILKCGAAYASLDPRWPAERVKVILNQACPQVVVGDVNDHQERFTTYRPRAEDIRTTASRRVSFTPVAAEASAPATVFFTSGTTGVPKGVVSPHQAVTRLFQSGGLDGFGPDHATPQAAALPWDMYAFELWGQLTSGGTSVLVNGDHLLPSTLRDLIRDVGVDTVWLTTTLFNLFVDEDVDCFDGLGNVFAGGEKLSAAHVRRFLTRFPDIPLRNGYGPVESCMLTATRLLRAADCDEPGGVPVGTAVPGTEVFVLDASDRPCAAGEAGEICIAGRGLAVGYLGDPELTAEKFPVVELNGRTLRLYRTGDQGTTDDQGVLHFRGRKDRQVKISGHRIELAEIEAAVRGLDGILDCAAVPLPGPEGQTAGVALFYLGTAEASGAADGNEAGRDPLNVRSQLAHLLPGYMLPRAVSWLPKFPVTANGKLDRSRLLQLARARQRPATPARKPESTCPSA